MQVMSSAIGLDRGSLWSMILHKKTGGKYYGHNFVAICDPSVRNQSHVGRVRFPLRAEMHERVHITDSCFIAFITSKIC